MGKKVLITDYKFSSIEQERNILKDIGAEVLTAKARQREI